MHRAASDADILVGLALTGHFLERDVLAPHGLAMPQARERLVSLLARRNEAPRRPRPLRYRGNLGRGWFAWDAIRARVSICAWICVGVQLPARRARSNSRCRQARRRRSSTRPTLIARQGLPPLSENAEASREAQAYADYLAETARQGHSADGRSPFQRLRASGAKFCKFRGENWHDRGRGRRAASPEAAVAAAMRFWKHSPGHERALRSAIDRDRRRHRRLAARQSVVLPGDPGVHRHLLPEAGADRIERRPGTQTATASSRPETRAAVPDRNPSRP